MMSKVVTCHLHLLNTILLYIVPESVSEIMRLQIYLISLIRPIFEITRQCQSCDYGRKVKKESFVLRSHEQRESNFEGHLPYIYSYASEDTVNRCLNYRAVHHPTDVDARCLASPRRLPSRRSPAFELRVTTFSDKFFIRRISKNHVHISHGSFPVPFTASLPAHDITIWL